jgi:hypothetical protein
VTLAVFRQLPCEELVAPLAAELRGVPWGRVNYCVKDCPESKHIHVVWQKGNELRRSVILPDSKGCGWLNRLADNLFHRMYCQMAGKAVYGPIHAKGNVRPLAFPRLQRIVLPRQPNG